MCSPGGISSEAHGSSSLANFLKTLSEKGHEGEGAATRRWESQTETSKAGRDDATKWIDGRWRLAGTWAQQSRVLSLKFRQDASEGEKIMAQANRHAGV